MALKGNRRIYTTVTYELTNETRVVDIERTKKK